MLITADESKTERLQLVHHQEPVSSLSQDFTGIPFRGEIIVF